MNGIGAFDTGLPPATARSEALPRADEIGDAVVVLKSDSFPA
jgi:hypothetical protein